jgi:hypothetical protein
MSIFGCGHNVKYLVVNKEHSERPVDADFTVITYHLHCTNCGKDVDIGHSKLIGGIKSYMQRGRDVVNRG